MTPLRVVQTLNKKLPVVFAQVSGVDSGLATVTRVASSPTDYNTIKFSELLTSLDYDIITVTFPSLGDVVAGTPQYLLSESSTVSGSSLEFRIGNVITRIQNVPIHQGIEAFAHNRVIFRITRSGSGEPVLRDIYLHFRFTGIKLA